MTVRRTALLAVLLLVGTTCLRADSPVEADPHELYERALEHLARGQLPECATALSRLHALIADRPDWDPEGAFANELLPPLLARLRRVEGAASRLEDFADRALQDLQPPDIKKDMNTVKDYTEWATSVIQRLRSERDDLVKADLTDPEERAILTRTESYARTERLLEVDVLERLADTAGDDLLGLLTGDNELESVLVRFRQLKRELIQAAAERDQLEQRLKESGERFQALLRTLGDVVTDDASPQPGSGGGEIANVGDRFARFLDGEREALRRRPSVTSAERDGLQSSLDRYRRYNQVLLAAGIGSDQGGKIEALTQAVEDIPAGEVNLAPPPTVGWRYALLIGALIACSGFLARLAVARGRRLASLQRPGGYRPPGNAVPADGTDAGRDAA